MWGEATYEVLVITVLSIIPLIGIAGWSYLHQRLGINETGHSGFYHFLSENLARGQLAFYAISNWAAVIWLCSREMKNAMAARAIVLVLCAVGYFIDGMLISPEPFAVGTENTVIASSGIVYGLSIACYFVVTLRAWSTICSPTAKSAAPKRAVMKSPSCWTRKKTVRSIGA